MRKGIIFYKSKELKTIFFEYFTVDMSTISFYKDKNLVANIPYSPKYSFFYEEATPIEDNNRFVISNLCNDEITQKWDFRDGLRNNFIKG